MRPLSGEFARSLAAAAGLDADGTAGEADAVDATVCEKQGRGARTVTDSGVRGQGQSPQLRYGLTIISVGIYYTRHIRSTLELPERP